MQAHGGGAVLATRRAEHATEPSAKLEHARNRRVGDPTSREAATYLGIWPINIGAFAPSVA